jgi:hypothetical protein
MSSKESMDFEPAYVPPPLTVQNSDEKRIPLTELLGKTARHSLVSALERLQGENFAPFLAELGMRQDDPRAAALAWKRGVTPNEYHLALEGNALPSEMRLGTSPRLDVRLRLASDAVTLSYSFRCEAESSTAQTVRQQLAEAETKAVAAPLNNVCAIALSQMLKEQLMQHPRVQGQVEQSILDGPRLGIGINTMLRHEIRF